MQDELTQAIINRVTELLEKHHIPIYDERKITGVRTVMIRKAIATNQVQLIFITSRDVFLAPVIKQLTAEFNMIKVLLMLTVLNQVKFMVKKLKLSGEMLIFPRKF